MLTNTEPSNNPSQTSQTIDFTLNHNDLMADAAKVVKLVFPSWTNANLKLVACEEGITNKLVKCSNLDENFTVLVRAYGLKTEILIDRDNEINNLVFLASLGLAPPLYARFNNGMVYGFIEGKVFDDDSMSDSKLSLLVAKTLKIWHSIVFPGVDGSSEKSPKLFPTLQNWLDALPTTYTNPKINDAINLFKYGDIKKELKFLEVELPTLNSPIAFCHNDLLSGNIINSNSTAIFIDYEYGSHNYIAFDIANHFCEFGGSENPIYQKTWPSKEFQKVWIAEYLGDGGDLVAVDKLYGIVEKFSLASHYYWALWGLVQAEISSIDFDYVGYSRRRLDEYYRLKELLF